MTKQRKAIRSSLYTVATLQTVARHATPRGRHQAANRFARLENERARLEREVGMWDSCRQTAERKLAKVREEIAALRPLLDDVPVKRAAFRKARGRKRAPFSTDTASRALVANRTMQLEY